MALGFEGEGVGGGGVGGGGGLVGLSWELVSGAGLDVRGPHARKAVYREDVATGPGEELGPLLFRNNWTSYRALVAPGLAVDRTPLRRRRTANG